MKEARTLWEGRVTGENDAQAVELLVTMAVANSCERPVSVLPLPRAKGGRIFNSIHLRALRFYIFRTFVGAHHILTEKKTRSSQFFTIIRAAYGRLPLQHRTIINVNNTEKQAQLNQV